MSQATSSLHLDAGRDFGGTQQQVLGLLRGLQRRGHHVVLCCPRSAPLFPAAAAAGIECQPLTLRSLYDFPSAVRLARLLGDGDFDLVHTHDAPSFGIARAARGISHHPALHQRLFVSCRRLATDLEPAERGGLEAPGVHWIAVSRYLREALLRRGADPERVAVVPSGVDLARLEDLQRHRDADPWGLRARGVRVIGTVGRLARHKNHGQLIDAFARLRNRHADTHLLIVGSGPMRPALERRVDQLGLRPYVTFTGHEADVLPAYGAMSLYVQTSEAEGSCSALLDAMAAGVPVVVTVCDGVLDLARHGDTALVVPPREPQVLADAMARLLEPGDLAARLVEGGVRLSRQRSLDAVVEAMLEIYAHLGDAAGETSPPD